MNLYSWQFSIWTSRYSRFSCEPWIEPNRKLSKTEAPANLQPRGNMNIFILKWILIFPHYIDRKVFIQNCIQLQLSFVKNVVVNAATLLYFSGSEQEGRKAVSGQGSVVVIINNSLVFTRIPTVKLNEKSFYKFCQNEFLVCPLNAKYSSRDIWRPMTTFWSSQLIEMIVKAVWLGYYRTTVSCLMAWKMRLLKTDQTRVLAVILTTTGFIENCSTITLSLCPCNDSL